MGGRKSGKARADASRGKRTAPRAGRRAGNPNTRGAILDAARKRFAAHGYERVTMRDVAGDARVDAALVHYFFGTKRELFGAAMELRVNPADAVAAILAGPRGELAERLLRRFLAVWDDADARPPLMAMVRSAMTDEHAAATLREFIVEEVVGPLARAGGTADAELRATLVGSQLLGLINARYILRVEPLASAGHDALVAAIAPVLQRYLTGDLKPRPGAQAPSG